LEIIIPMLLKVCVFAGSSKGNAIFVRINNDRILIDAGISTKRLEKSLKEIQEPDPSFLTGILITHEHQDHSKGLKTLAKKYQLKCWLTYETYTKIRSKSGPIDTEFIEISDPFEIGNTTVTPFEIQHDAIDPTAYVLSNNNLRIGILLDCGKSSPYLFDNFRNLDILIIEANHSFDKLLSSDYPDYLKHRILSDKGHLSNWHTAEFISEVQPKIAILSHISEQNNSAEIALCEVEEYLAYSGLKKYPFFVIVNPTTRSTIITKGF
jgi:phosphoribosyl 1,2-cyclic phosphodiesterase